MRRYYIAQLLISILLLAILFLYSGFSLDALLGLSPIHLALAYASMLSATLFIALSLYMILRLMGLRVSIGGAVKANFAAQFLSDITPARLGYFALPVFLRRYGVGAAAGLAAAFMIGVMNAIVKMFFGILALYYLSGLVSLSAAQYVALLAGLGVLVATVVLIAFVAREEYAVRIEGFLGDKPVIGRLYTRFFAGFLREIARVMGGIDARVFAVTLPLAASLFMNALSLYFAATALGINIGVLDAVVISSLASVLMYFPVSIGGIGVQENVNTVLLYLLGGAPLQLCATASIVYRAVLIAADAPGLPIAAAHTADIKKYIGMRSAPRPGLVEESPGVAGEPPPRTR